MRYFKFLIYMNLRYKLIKHYTCKGYEMVKLETNKSSYATQRCVSSQAKIESYQIYDLQVDNSVANSIYKFHANLYNFTPQYYAVFNKIY